MLRRTYSIILQTTIGDRPGTMEVQIEKNQVTGRLNVLKRSEPFRGTVDKKGNCHISGTLVTLMSTLSYTAKGKMDETSLHLFLESERTSFPVVGTILQPE